MYAIVEPSPSDWDAFVLNHPQGHLLQLLAWGNLKYAFGWHSQQIAIVENAALSTEPGEKCLLPGTARILAGAQVLFRQKFMVSAAYVPRGPLFSGDSTIDDLLLAALERLAHHHHAVFLRLEPNLTEDDPQARALQANLVQRKFQPTEPMQPRSTIHLDLKPPLEKIFASFSKGHRADIRRAERQGVQVRVGAEQDLALFYAIMQATSKRATFGIHEETYYKLAWQLFHRHSRLLLAEKAGQTLAAHLVFADSQNGLYFYSGAMDEGLKTGANHLLEWHALQWAKEQGCQTYDLWGIPDALGKAALATSENERLALEAEAQNDPLIGVYRFKKGFGGQIVRYLPAYDHVFLWPLYALWQHGMG